MDYSWDRQGLGGSTELHYAEPATKKKVYGSYTQKSEGTNFVKKFINDEWGGKRTIPLEED